jgi:DUF4097 and DUF4098 domain-containing protein YvlB
VLLVLVTGTLAFAGVQQMDTTVAVSRGQRLDVNAFGGEVTVHAWNRNAIRVEATTSGRDRVEVSSSATAINVRTQGRHGPPSEVQLQISAPSWVGLTLSGVNTSMKVVGLRAPITAETVEGEIDVTGGDGLVSLRSVQGSVTLRGARGRINLNSVNEDVRVSGSAGDVVAQTVNGEIDLQVTDAPSVDASTVNGDIRYSGPIRNGGRYSLSTHNGDISLTVAEGTSASVAVSTFSGEFESEFPVPLRGTRQGKGFNFTLGSGSAQVTLESFQGTIELVRPGSERDRSHHEHDGDEDDHDHE